MLSVRCLSCLSCQSVCLSVLSVTFVRCGKTVGRINLIFINDLDLNIRNLLFKFADDTKLCAKISTTEDIEKLQEDLNTLQEWARDWQMQFNVQKCKAMRVGSNTGSNVLSEYSMGNHRLEYCSVLKSVTWEL